MVYKDVVVQRSVLLIYSAFAVFFATQVITGDGPLAVTAALAMMFSFNATALDERTNIHLLLNSLPVTRQDIVTAKYVFHIAAGLCFVVIAAVCRTVAGGLTLRAALVQILAAAALIVWFLSVFFPAYYWLGPRFVQIGLFSFAIVFLPAAGPVYNWAAKHDFGGLLDVLPALPTLSLYLVMTAITLAVLLGSWRVSVWLYSRKEF